MTFKYSLVSDLHLDFPHPKTPEMEQFVIVAGDTSNGLLGLKYLQKLKRKGHTVFAVDGNHEHYSNECQQRTVTETTQAFYSGLNQTRIHPLPDHKLKIIGCNGWYEVLDEDHWFRYMNDGRYGNTSAKEVTSYAQDHAQWIRQNLEDLESGWKAIVVTHTSPHPMSLDPRYIGSDGNQYFFNPWMGEIMYHYRDRIAVWHHGHTHKGLDQTINGVRIVSNPRGYPKENPDWKPLSMSI